MKKNDQFSFEISLSVLNHLGRNLYRSFVTVLGEAISNAWDADAKNVWIYVDKAKNNFVIKDDGAGMTASDFQNKFLKIGYSKRKDGQTKSSKGRPFIGRKGIGKLALLSCADRISVISKTKNSEYIGGTIDNSGLDRAITDDLNPEEYPLAIVDRRHFSKHTKDHNQGTIIYFENIKSGIRNSLDILKKITALYFRFSILDSTFNIFIDDEKITYRHLNDLAEKTEFLWRINGLKDPFVDKELKNVKEIKDLTVKGTYRGFIGSVGKPTNLTIMGMEERVSVDLFVNGRLREKNILKHIPTSRIVDYYIYGQIHFDELDADSTDRFTSDREGVVADDSKYQLFRQNFLNDVMRVVIDDWDVWRRKHREDGDSENTKKISKKDRKSEELFNVVSDEYSPAEGSKNKSKIDKWVDNLARDAQFNFGSYAECFISENLIREYIREKKLSISPEAQEEIKHWKKKESVNKNKGNISIEIRRMNSDTSYLSMDDLAYMVDKRVAEKEACLARDANEYKPVRDALAHTALLTDEAKRKLTSVFANIRGRLNTLFSK